MKSMNEALTENVVGYEGWLHGCVQDDGNGPYFRRDLWPVSELGEAPTDEQIAAWMAA
jgi:hypothetical protein